VDRLIPDQKIVKTVEVPEQSVDSKATARRSRSAKCASTKRKEKLRGKKEFACHYR
jgi:hypothetical protein